MTRPARAVIAEDEPLLRAGLRDALGRLWPELAICAEAEDGIEALHALDAALARHPVSRHPDAGHVGARGGAQADGTCHVVFVTAFDEYAVAAFEQGAVDYVMKPLSTARLATTVARLRSRSAARRPVSMGCSSLAEPRGRRRSALDHRVARQRGAPDHGRRDVLLPRRQQVHAGRHRASSESLIRRPIKELIEQLDPPCSGRFIAARSSTSTRSPAWCATSAGPARQAEAAQGDAAREREPCVRFRAM